MDRSYNISCLIPNLPVLAELQPYLERIENNKRYTNFGPLVSEYENRLTELTGAKKLGGQCITLASGTAALELGIAALELPENASVLLPAFTFPATLLAVLRCGLTPVLADVDRRTWTLSPDLARIALKERDFALVLPVASFGMALPEKQWDAFTSETGIPVLMDAASALSTQQIGKTTSAAFSLHATKPLGVGEGGVFAVADTNIAEKVRNSSNFGFYGGTVINPMATNAKLSEYAAAVGLAQLARWPAISSRRRSILASYRAALLNMPGIAMQANGDLASPAVLTVSLAAGAETVAEVLMTAGIETRRWYVPPLHLHPVFSDIERMDLPVTEHLFRTCLGLPFHDFLTMDDIQSVANFLSTMGTHHGQ